MVVTTQKVESLTFHFCDNSKNHFPPRYLFVSFFLFFSFSFSFLLSVSLQLRIICSLKCSTDAEYSTNDSEMFENLSPSPYLTHNAHNSGRLGSEQIKSFPILLRVRTCVRRMICCKME